MDCCDRYFLINVFIRNNVTSGDIFCISSSIKVGDMLCID